MVKRLSRVGVFAALVFALLVGLALPAYAGFGTNPPPSGGSGGNPSKSQTPGSSGTPTQTVVKTCSLYATSSNFGLSCYTPGASDGKPGQRVVDLLKGDPLPTCWDTLISDADLATQYQYVPNPGAPYYLHTCITGLNPDSPPDIQPNVQLNQQVIEIPAGAPECPKPYTAAMVGHCVMTLTTNQQKVVGPLQSRPGNIPSIVLITQPSTQVRTNQSITYVDENATNQVGPFTVGGVQMRAVRTSFQIFPYGPSGQVMPCSGEAGGTSLCTWTYPQSSAGQPGQAYPFRAEADWTVQYNSGAGWVTLASFHKYDDLQLPVYDVQTLVVGG